MRFKICHTVFTIMIFSAFLCSCISKKDIQNEKPDNINPNCSHDLSTYTEPTVRTGKYYLNGDVNNYYFEVTDNTVKLCNADLNELITSWQPGGEDFYSGDGIDEESLKLRLESKEDFIKDYSVAHEYIVKTDHETYDKPGLLVFYNNNRQSYLFIKDENTLTGFGKDGDFILVEE